MYLCNLKLTGKDLPATLPEKMKNEVSSMVDIISFSVDDDRPQSAPRTNVPNFEVPPRQNAISPPAPQAPQPQQASNQQLLTQLTSQPTGFYNQAIGFQPGLQPQPTGLPIPNQGLQPQVTGFLPVAQASGYTGPRPPMPPMPSSFGTNMSPQQTGGGALQAQPTGIPGQWGFVNAPASGLPNIEALQQRLMPQAGREGGFTTQGLSGSAKIPWAVTKDEKQIYDQLFKAWDGLKRGFISGDVAIEIMGQSGLDRKDLEAIWTLSDPNNTGRLNTDEFAVAMHLIYRKLNGYPVPNRLPPELIPPSTRNFNTSIDTVKSLLSQDAEARKNSGAFLQPQKTGVSYLKNHSFRTESSSPTFGRKDATVFRNNDEDVGYRSSARRRVGADGRTPSPVQSRSPVSEASFDDMSADQIRKKIREKKIYWMPPTFKMRTRRVMMLFLIVETKAKQKTFSDRSEGFRMILILTRILACDLPTPERSVGPCDVSCSGIKIDFLLSHQMYAKLNATSQTPKCSFSDFGMPNLIQIALQISWERVPVVPLQKQTGSKREHVPECKLVRQNWQGDRRHRPKTMAPPRRGWNMRILASSLSKSVTRV